MEKAYINFTVYVKRHIINEENDYRVEYDFLHCNINRAYKGTFKDYFESSSILDRFDVNGAYRLYIDLNQYQEISLDCHLISILSDDDRMLNISHVPYKGAQSVRYLQVAPDQEKWIKYVTLDDKEIEEAKKIMSEIDKQPFTKKRRVDITL